MKTAIDDLKVGIENLQRDEKRLTISVVNQESALVQIKKDREKTRNQIKDYETALAVLRVAEGHGKILLDEEDK